MDFFSDITQTADSGYIMGSFSRSNISGDKTEDSRGDYDYWIVKLNSQGVVEWDKTFGGSMHDRLHSIRTTSDGGYICSGHSYSSASGDKTENVFGDGTSADLWIIKLNANGEIEWQNNIGGDLSDTYASVLPVEDGYMCVGQSRSMISGDKTENAFGMQDIWVLKLSTNGEIEWQKSYGGSGEEYQASIEKISNGNYILGGSSNSGISGNKTESLNGEFDYWFLEISANAVITDVNIEEKSNSFLTIMPNPFVDKLTLNFWEAPKEHFLLKIFDIKGNVVKQNNYYNTNQAIIFTGNLPVGLYMYQVLENNQIIFSGKISHK